MVAAPESQVESISPVNSLFLAGLLQTSDSMVMCWAFKMKAENTMCMYVHWPGRVRLPVHRFLVIFFSLAFVFACSGAVWLLGVCHLAALSLTASPFSCRPHAEGLKKVREEIPLTPASLLAQWVTLSGGREETLCKNTIVKAASKQHGRYAHH